MCILGPKERLVHLDKAAEIFSIEAKRAMDRASDLRRGPVTQLLSSEMVPDEGPSLPYAAMSIQLGGWYLCDILIMKAQELAKFRRHHDAAIAFRRSQAEFESSVEVSKESAWWYFKGAWFFFDLQAHSLQRTVIISDAISWVCSQSPTRRRTLHFWTYRGCFCRQYHR